jgi:hypothetical protein
MHATCSVHLILFELIILIISGEKYQVTKLLVMVFSPACYFIPSQKKKKEERFTGRQREEDHKKVQEGKKRTDDRKKERKNGNKEF